MARYIEIKGKAKPLVAVGVLAIVAWSLFGQSLFNFHFGLFSRSYQTSLFRGGHFEVHGVHWQQQNRNLGRIVSFGGESLIVDLDASIERGTLAVFAWHWPAFLYDEHMIFRTRFRGDTEERIWVELPGPGVYTLSISGVYFGGDVTLDWRIGGEP